MGCLCAGWLVAGGVWLLTAERPDRQIQGQTDTKRDQTGNKQHTQGKREKKIWKHTRTRERQSQTITAFAFWHIPVKFEFYLIVIGQILHPGKCVSYNTIRASFWYEWLYKINKTIDLIIPVSWSDGKKKYSDALHYVKVALPNCYTIVIRKCTSNMKGKTYYLGWDLAVFYSFWYVTADCSIQ